MKDKKREFLPLYSFYDRSGIANHLEEMAQKGWLLEKMDVWYWQYRRIEPQKLHFAVTYFPKATQFSPAPAEGLETFRDFCAEAGWKAAADSAQVQIFYNEQPNPIPIETDVEADFENIHRSMQKSFLGSYWALLVLCLFEVVFHVWRLLDDPVEMLSSAAQLNAVFGFLPLAILVVTELIRYYRWRKRARAAIETGAPLPELRSARKLGLLIILLAAVEFVLLLTTSLASSAGMAATVIFMIMMVYMFLMIWLSNGIRRCMQKLHFKAWLNRLVTFGMIILMTVGMMAGIVLLVFHTDWFDESKPAETYEHNGWTFKVYHDELPLTIEDLVPDDYDRWSTELRRESSPLLTHLDASQRSRLGDGDHPDLDYEVVIVKVPLFYDLCKNDFIDWLERQNHEMPEEHWDVYEPVDGAPWGAAEVYQRYSSGEPISQFLVCWPDRIAEVDFDWNWTITDDMIRTAAEKLLAAK